MFDAALKVAIGLVSVVITWAVQRYLRRIDQVEATAKARDEKDKAELKNEISMLRSEVHQNRERTEGMSRDYSPRLFRLEKGDAVHEVEKTTVNLRARVRVLERQSGIQATEPAPDDYGPEGGTKA